MAVDVKPVLVIAGEVLSVDPRSFTNRETGEVEDKGRVAVVKTARGFVQLKLPVRNAGVEIAAGDRGAWYVTPFEWGFVRDGAARYGVAYVYEEAVPRSAAEALLATVAQAA
ncbi:hypothetical protein [Microbacterium sp. 4NA327F11]|uniref:hypothetical protein n=1 Tax=Microbacterium sp. 4NA327F11 TaxID=2502229 RepID=UPI0010F7A5EA|nr:hypothetical protein [Microbacterium sp. 4NA327F11]